MLDGAPVLLKTRRLFPSRNTGVVELRRATLWAQRLLERFRPGTIAIVSECAADDAWCRELREAIASCADNHAISPVELGRTEVAVFLGLASSSNSAIRAELARRHAALATYVSPLRGGRSESERYWENAVLATAVAQAAEGLKNRQQVIRRAVRS